MIPTRAIALMVAGLICLILGVFYLPNIFKTQTDLVLKVNPDVAKKVETNVIVVKPTPAYEYAFTALVPAGKTLILRSSISGLVDVVSPVDVRVIVDCNGTRIGPKMLTEYTVIAKAPDEARLVCDVYVYTNVEVKITVSAE